MRILSTLSGKKRSFRRFITNSDGSEVKRGTPPSKNVKKWHFSLYFWTREQEKSHKFGNFRCPSQKKWCSGSTIDGGHFSKRGILTSKSGKTNVNTQFQPSIALQSKNIADLRRVHVSVLNL